MIINMTNIKNTLMYSCQYEWKLSSETWTLTLSCKFRRRDNKEETFVSIVVQCWANVADGGPALNQHWVDVSQGKGYYTYPDYAVTGKQSDNAACGVNLGVYIILPIKISMLNSLLLFILDTITGGYVPESWLLSINLGGSASAWPLSTQQTRYTNPMLV